MWGKERIEEPERAPDARPNGEAEAVTLEEISEGDSSAAIEEDTPRQLVLLGQAQRALAEATSLDEIKDIRDKAEAARKYVESARLGLKLQNHAAEVKLRAERRAGQLLSRLNLPGGDRRSRTAGKTVTLEDLGLTKHQSSRWQREASVPEDVFERFLQEANESALELTSRALLKLAREFAPDKPGEESQAGGADDGSVFGSIEEIREAGLRFGCVYADPPLLVSAEETDAFGRSAISIEQLCALPVAELVEEDAHAHLWLGSSHLPHAQAILNAWGFEYRSNLVWVRPQGVSGKFWRHAHDFLLLGVRGDLSFRNRSILSWLRANRMTHGRKPERVRRSIQQVSPGPYLELFARKPVKGWVVCGDGFQQ